MKHVLIDLPSAAEVTRCRLAALPGIRVHVAPPHHGRELPPALLRGKHVLLCKSPPENFGELTDLEYLQIATVGYEHLRHLDLGRRSATACNARGVFDTAIGEWNLAMMVNLARDLRRMVRNQEAALWIKEDRFEGEVRGRVVGLWGYGGIGRETARLARAFGMTVHALSRTGVGPRRDVFCLPGAGDPEGLFPDRVFTAGQEREFLSTLDFLVLALPHTQKSTGLVGAAELKALPPTAFLLNPARGPLVQEPALLAALREGWIAGAALDTHFAYPLPPEHPLWKMPNVLLTPHVSGADHSPLFPARIAELFAQNVERYLAGRRLLNVVTAAEWAEA